MPASADLLLCGLSYFSWCMVAGGTNLSNRIGDRHDVIGVRSSLALFGLCCDDCPTIWHSEFLAMFKT
jgi:hypothetical protein